MVVKKIAVLFSGDGSNLENIIKKLHKKEFSDFKIEVCCLISNKSDAYGIQRAKKYGLETRVIEHKNFSNREEFDKELVRIIKKSEAELVVLAGFMRILTPIFTDNVKAINLHPSLLPLFKGANAIEESYKSDMKVAGVSVHFVSEELDGGKIIAQECFNKEDLSFESFRAKIKECEKRVLGKAVIKVLENSNFT